MNNNIEIKVDLRPCIVNSDKKALFHRWFDMKNYISALVEFEDGTVDLVEHKHIKFCDSGNVFRENELAFYAYDRLFGKPFIPLNEDILEQWPKEYQDE